MALTATATPVVIIMLKQILCNPIGEIASMNKSNMTYYAYEFEAKGMIILILNVLKFYITP